MSDIFIRLGQGAAVSWKAAVNTAASLPTSGNAIGDVRAVTDTTDLYMWDGGTWQLISGSGGGSPGAPSGSIQYNNAGNFAGDTQLVWNNTGKILELNGLAIRALSNSVSLVDNTASPTTAFSYSASSYNYSIIEYSLTRNTAKQVGRLYVVNDAVNVSLTNDFGNLEDTGVVFFATISAGNVNIQYTTTNTGFNAFLKYSIRQWI